MSTNENVRGSGSADSVKSNTIPSGSVAETGTEVAVPKVVLTDAGQVATGGSSNSVAGVGVLRGPSMSSAKTQSAGVSASTPSVARRAPGGRNPSSRPKTGLQGKVS